MKRPISARPAPVVARLSTVALLAGLFVLPVLAGCPGSLGAGPWPGPTGSGGNTGNGTGGSPATGTGGGSGMNCPDMPMLMATSCKGSACHDPTFAAIWGDFVSPDVASRLIGKPAMASMPCNNQTMLVNPTKPASGVLFERLTTTTCGTRKMPPTDGNTNPLPPANFVDCLKSWLEPQLQ